jgi:hypothetical protein
MQGSCRISALFLAFLLACSRTDVAEERAWVHTQSNVNYSFPECYGNIRGDELVVGGRVRRHGNFQPHWVHLVLVGSDLEGNPKVTKDHTVRMRKIEEWFTIRVAFQEDLEWSVGVRDGSGGLQRSIRKLW